MAHGDEYKEEPNEADGNMDPFYACILDQANKRGLAIVTSTTCPHCREKNFHSSYFSESLTCMHANCRKRYASGIPRPPLAGDTTDEIWRHALATVHDGALQAAKTVPLLADEDTAKLTPDQRMLVARAINTAFLHACQSVRRIAEELAEKVQHESQSENNAR